MMPVLAALGLAGLGIWILGPLRAPLRRRGQVEDARWKELVDAKNAVYRSILDLEFDQSVGKVSDADYAFLRRQQETEALAILAEMDALAAARSGAPAGGAGEGHGGPEGDGGGAPAGLDTLEAEIAAARERLHAGRPTKG